MRGTVVVLVFLAEAAAWAAASWGGRSVWRTLPPVFAAIAIAAPLVTLPRDPHGGRATAFAVGAVSGIAPFLATGVFVAVASRWERFRRTTEESYALEAGAPFRVVLVLALLVSVPGEELFWRGFAAPVLGGTS